ncbi:MAG: NUDIX hydrolase [Euryarchaeota archaeon]|nr:NUDIX hydrolase [Euryarchaeota archaeon]
MAVDVVIKRADGSIVLVKRAFDPFKGYWALPGGFLKFGNSVEDTAIREAKEETGLDIEIEDVLGVYSDSKRDPRGHIISICLTAREVGGELRAGSDAAEVKSFLKPPEKLAFDHKEMLRKAGFVKE